jgi:ferritin-like metal-binding protein YciE
MAAKKSINNLEELFLHTLSDIYFAEQAIVRALPQMVKKAGNEQLREGFEAHLEETKQQIKRLETVFQSCNQKAHGERCPAIEGIIEEANELAAEIGDAQTKDLALAAAAQAVEHYEISRYGTLISLAKRLGHKEAIKPLQETLAEEKAADVKLTKVSESVLMRDAA